MRMIAIAKDGVQKRFKTSIAGESDPLSDHLGATDGTVGLHMIRSEIPMANLGVTQMRACGILTVLASIFLRKSRNVVLRGRSKALPEPKRWDGGAIPCRASSTPTVTARTRLRSCSSKPKAIWTKAVGTGRSGILTTSWSRITGPSSDGSAPVTVPFLLGSFAHDRRLRSDPYDSQRPSVRPAAGAKVCSYDLAKFRINLPDIRLIQSCNTSESRAKDCVTSANWWSVINGRFI